MRGAPSTPRSRASCDTIKKNCSRGLSAWTIAVTFGQEALSEVRARWLDMSPVRS